MNLAASKLAAASPLGGAGLSGTFAAKIWR